MEPRTTKSVRSGQVRPPDDYVWLEEVLPKHVVESCKNEIKKLFSIKVKESDYEANKKYFNESGEIIFDKSEFPELGDAAMESGGLLIPEDSFSYMNSYINIVTESQFRDDFNVIHVSEKSLRPFAYFNLPLIVGTQNHVKYMKDKYGFDFYDDLINHDYDNQKSIANRITMIIDEVIRLKNEKENVINFYKQNTHRLINNQKIISEIKNNTDDYDFFKTIMS